MVCCQEDICIGATNENEFKKKKKKRKKTDIILNRLRNAGMTINEKCVNNISKISFLGYSISKEGISPDQALIENILKIAIPTNQERTWIFGGIDEFLQAICTKIYRPDWIVCKFKKKRMLNLSGQKNNKKLLIKSNYGKETSRENFW